MSSDQLDGERGNWLTGEIRTSSRDREAAVVAVAELFSTLRIEYAFVGEVAIAAWMESPFNSGSVDALALVSPDRARQLPMMASNRGFRVEQTEVQAAEELDLIPMYHGKAGSEIRIHLLLASNALYAKMVTASIAAQIGEVEVRILNAEDMALLLIMSEGPEATSRLEVLIIKAGDSFESDRFNRRLVSIGLGGKLVSR